MSPDVCWSSRAAFIRICAVCNMSCMHAVLQLQGPPRLGLWALLPCEGSRPFLCLPMMAAILAPMLNSWGIILTTLWLFTLQ
jgi:hypothetical protein